MDHTDEIKPKNQEVRLHCLADEPIPPEMIADWKCFQSLPPKGQQNIWDILSVFLPSEPDQDVLEERGEAYCKLYDVPAEALHRAIQVCRFLLGQAAGLDLSKEEFAGDLEKLSGNFDEGTAVFISGYDEAKGFIRQEIRNLTFLDHGKVLTDIDWRIDMMAASSRGVNLDMPAVLLTLTYQEGGVKNRKSKEITLNLTPEMMLQLGLASKKVTEMITKRSLP